MTILADVPEVRAEYISPATPLPRGRPRDEVDCDRNGLNTIRLTIAEHREMVGDCRESPRYGPFVQRG